MLSISRTDPVADRERIIVLLKHACQMLQAGPLDVPWAILEAVLMLPGCTEGLTEAINRAALWSNTEWTLRDIKAALDRFEQEEQ